MRFNSRYLNRAGLVLGHSVNQILPAFINMLTALLVIRFTSVTLWGEFVYVTIVFAVANSVIGWGNKEYLLRAFSRDPRHITLYWQTSLLTRAPLLGSIALAVAAFTDVSWPGMAYIGLWGLGIFWFRSFEVLIIYYKRFMFAVILETISGVVLITAITWFRELLSLDLLFLFFAVSAWIKAVCVSVLLRNAVLSRWAGGFDIQFFRKAFTFFFLTLAGLLEIKVDLLCINYYLSKSDVGRYQVLMMFLVYMKNSGYFLTAPFVKNIYRLGEGVLRKLKGVLVGWGIALLIPGVLLIRLVIGRLYGLDFGWDVYLLGYLFSVPHFFYLLKSYQLIRNARENTLLGITTLGIGLNLAFNILLIPHLGLLGAVCASTLTQWALLILYRYHDHLGRVIGIQNVHAKGS